MAEAVIKDYTRDADDEMEEYVEYNLTSREYFLQSLCQLCKMSFLKTSIICNNCRLVFYCSTQHMAEDSQKHKDFCMAINILALQRGGHVYNNINGISHKEYQAVRLNAISNCERILHRILSPYEKEALLYPRVCNFAKCREWRPEELESCNVCKQVFYCRKHLNHSQERHEEWCKHLKFFERIISHQAKFGKISIILPSKVIRAQSSANLSTFTQVFGQLYKALSDIGNLISYSELTQMASPPTTTWFALKLTGLIKSPEVIIHIIGAEHHFEVSTLEKWEIFLMHLIPYLNKINIVFVGPELNISNSQLAVLQKQRLCNLCRQRKKEIKYDFISSLYDKYAITASYRIPSLVCYFNPGLYRKTGFQVFDTWPETIKATASIGCPILVTSYTSFESTLDIKSYLKTADRPMEIILPPILNPFRSLRPERNFVSENQAPLIYKNFYLFLLE